ncbi:hypothetical protein ACO0SA_002560 [Hanseniaspora valbyensis]
MSDSKKIIPVMKNGFIPVPFKLNKNECLQIENDEIIHYIFMKKHQSSKKEENTIFLYNLPLLTTFETLALNLNKIVNQFKGQVIFDKNSENFKTDEFKLEAIDLNSLSSDYILNENNETVSPKQALGGSEFKGESHPYNTTYLTLLDNASLKSFFTCINKYIKKNEVFEWEYPETVNMPSLEQFQGFYKPLPLQYLKELVMQTMEDFNERENIANEELITSSNLVDEDGFTLVVGKNTKTKSGLARNTEALKNPLMKYNKTIKKQRAGAVKKGKWDGHLDFYRFQQREKKKVEIGELLSKFKKDQAKIIQWKESGKFNPYK